MPLDGNGKKGVIWATGIILTAALIVGVGVVVRYITESHDAIIRLDQTLPPLIARMEKIEVWRIEISDLASKRTEYIKQEEAWRADQIAWRARMELRVERMEAEQRALTSLLRPRPRGSSDEPKIQAEEPKHEVSASPDVAGVSKKAEEGK